MNTEHESSPTNRHLVEVPDTFAVARWLARRRDVGGALAFARCASRRTAFEA
jgi:hypothetical protein